MISTKWFAGDADLTDAYGIRRRVFIEEQNVPEAEDFDGTDLRAAHVVLYEDGAPTATGRVIVVDGQCMLGRICCLKEKRRKGYGDCVMRMLIRKAFSMGHEEQFLHAQVQAVPFYETLGFRVFGEPFDEAGIPHRHMKRSGDITGDC